MGDDLAFKSFKSEIENNNNKLTIDFRYRLIHYSSNFFNTPVIEKNKENEEAMMVIFPQLPEGPFTFFKQLIFMLKAKKLRLPYLILQPQKVKNQWTPKNIIVPVTYRRTDKETSAWVSYFARFGNSKITLLYANEDNIPALRDDIRNNLNFMKNIFKKVNIEATTIAAKSSSGKLYDETINFAHQKGNSMVIITSTRYYGIEHFFVGPVELHIIKNKHKIPVMIINTRKDLYVLCK